MTEGKEFTLEGIVSRDNPSGSDITMELSYLLAGRVDFVMLKNGLDFMQAMVHPERSGCFLVEAGVWTGSGCVLRRQNRPLSPAGTRRIFVQYLRGALQWDETWATADEPTRAGGTGKGGSAALAVVAILVVAGAGAAAQASNRPWIEGCAAGLLAVLYLWAVVRVVGKCLDGAHRRIILRSIELGMPCDILWGSRLMVLDRKTRSIGKVARLEAMLLTSAMAGGLMAMALLAAALGIGRAAQSCALP